MKGALIKELYAFKASRMIALIIVYAVVILLSALFPTPWFSLVLFVLAFVAPLTYASNDERYGWKGLVKALPVSTAKRVAARYIICTAELLLDTAVTSLFNLLSESVVLANAVNDAVLLFFIGALGTASVLLVSNIPQRGLRIPMGILAVITFSEWIFLLFVDTFRWFVGFKAILAFEKWIIPLVVFGGVLLLVLSYLLTVHFSTQRFDRKPKVKKSIAVTAACFGVIVCLSTAVLGVKGRLIPEPMIDFDTFLNFGSSIIFDDSLDIEDKSIARLFYNVRKTTNRQELSNIEMNEVLRKLAGKEICKEDSEETKAVLKQAGLEAWDEVGLLTEPGDLMCSSKYETLNGYYYSSCFTLYSDCQAKYIAVTDDSEMDFDREGFESGISELELLNLLEEKGMTVKEFCEDSYYYGPAYREYTVYIVYENVLTKELKIDCIIFLVEEGKFTKYTVTPWSGEEYDSEYDNELAIPDEEHIETAREYMMNYANAFCEEALAGGDMDTCRQKLDAIGAQKAESSVFENYILGDDHLTLSFDESSAYPGKVSFIKAVGLTGAKRYESLSKSEIAEIERKFSIGMSDKELVELLENEELYPASIYENIDYTYNPEKIYKCYSFLLEIGVFDHNGMYDQSCEIRVELYDGAVTNTIVYLDGYTELETTEQYSELDEMWEYLNMYTESEQGMSLAELVDVFEEMSKKPIESVDSEWDGVLFETYEWDGDFVFSLARQIPNGYDDEFYQLHMDVYYSCSDSSYESFSELDWGDSGDANFFKGVRNSQAYTALKDEPIIAVDIYIDGT